MTIFSEPQTDIISENLEYDASDRILATEYLPGQFDQRADSCDQCIQLLTRGERPFELQRYIYSKAQYQQEEFDSIKRI